MVLGLQLQHKVMLMVWVLLAASLVPAVILRLTSTLSISHYCKWAGRVEEMVLDS